MKQTKQQKVENSKEFAKVLKDSGSIYFTAYQGLKFVELAQLRAQLRKQKSSFKVLKNSMLGNALKQAGIGGIDEKLLEGPNAVAFSQSDDPISTVKLLLKFAKEFPNLKVKAGYVGAQWIGAAECARLSQIGSKPELLAQLAGALYSAVAQSAGVLAAPIRDFVLVLKALEEKKKSAGAAA
jgi:large subunit ribosomal protein L10